MAQASNRDPKDSEGPEDRETPPKDEHHQQREIAVHKTNVFCHRPNQKIETIAVAPLIYKTPDPSYMERDHRQATRDIKPAVPGGNNCVDAQGMGEGKGEG